MLRIARRVFSICYPPDPARAKHYTIGVIPGDGIGPEVTNAALTILRYVGAPLEFREIAKLAVEDEATIQMLKSCDAILKGTISHMVAEGPGSPNLLLRKKLDTFANVVHAISMDGISTRFKDIDVIVIRENLEGEYSGLEHEVYPGVVESVKVITEKESLRIAEYAFQLAFLNNRKKVTAVHKANIMKMVDGQFLKCTRVVSARYPTIQYEEMIIDNASMQMTRNPWQFDVVLLPNLYGAIVANIVTFLVGGPGVTPGANLGASAAMFEQGTRHLAKDIAGKDLANPTAMILSSVMMLRYLNLPHFADRIQQGLFATISTGRVRTQDVGGSATCTGFTQEVVKSIK